MGFRPVNFAHLVKFNSAASSEFIDFYEDILREEIRTRDSQPKHKTFAPSSFRCDRISWFRLRGVQPDTSVNPDLVLEFSAVIGTACHENIQKHLSEKLGCDWISVEDHLKENEDLKNRYDWKLETSGYETRISISNPPIRFACDGLFRWKGKKYLLEIKTSEFSSFDELTEPKERHVDQIKCYSYLLGVPDVLVLYQDRQYGGLKCYEMHVSSSDWKYVENKFNYRF